MSVNNVEEWKNKGYLIATNLEELLRAKVREWRLAGTKPTGKIDEILKRKNNKRQQVNTDELGLPIVMYFRDVIAIFVEHARVLDKNKEANRVWVRFQNLKVNDIRNELSHAGLVTKINYDALVEFALLKDLKALGIDLERRVEWVNSLNLYEAAEEKAEAIQRGEILIWPPNEVIPNNLPETFEHSETGLIGRADVLKDLREWVTQENSYPNSIVAPGGYGKTAVALEMLRKLSREGAYLNEIEGIVFVSFKEIALGKEIDYTVLRPPLSCSAEIEAEVLNAVSLVLEEEDAEDIFDFADRRIVLCLDNLENVAARFPDFMENYLRLLPQEWKVLMTSRVALLGVRPYKLDKLSEEASVDLCCKLVRKTFACDESYIPAILSRAKGHPLAIIRSVYLVSLGRDPFDAIELAGDQVARYSFDAITVTFSREEKEFLCAVELAEVKTRVVIGEISGIKDEDEFNRIFTKLSTLRCVHRKLVEDTAIFELESYLSTYIDENVDLIDAINAVSKRLQARESRLDQNNVRLQSESIYEENYIRRDCPAGLTDDIREYLKLKVAEGTTKSKAIKLGELQGKFCSHGRPEQYDKCPDYHFYLGKLYKKNRGHTKDARHAFSRVLELDSKYVQGKLAYCDSIMKGNSEEALKLIQELIDLDLHDPNKSSLFFADELLRSYGQALNFGDKSNDVLAFSSDWKRGAPELYGTYAFMRIYAHARLTETNSSHVFDQLMSGISDYEYVVDLKPKERFAKPCGKLVNQITHWLARPDVTHYLSPDEVAQLENRMRWLVETVFKGQTIEIPELSRNYLQRYDWFTKLRRVVVDEGAAPCTQVPAATASSSLAESVDLHISIHTVRVDQHFIGSGEGVDVLVNWNSLKSSDRASVSIGTKMKVNAIYTEGVEGQLLKATRAILLEA